jgi:hypothetical protein
MQDIVVCKGFVGTTPKIEFVTKSIEIINICDEKVYPNTIIKSTEQALATHGLSLKQVQVYGDAEARYYHFFIETVEDTDSLDKNSFEKELQQQLIEQAESYKVFSVSNVLKPLKVTWMKKGWQESLIQVRLSSGISRTQIKLPIVIKERPQKSWYQE